MQNILAFFCNTKKLNNKRTKDRFEDLVAECQIHVILLLGTKRCFCSALKDTNTQGHIEVMEER